MSAVIAPAKKPFPTFRLAAVAMASLVLASVLVGNANEQEAERVQAAQEQQQYEQGRKENLAANREFLKTVTHAPDRTLAGNVTIRNNSGEELRVGDVIIKYHVDPSRPTAESLSGRPFHGMDVRTDADGDRHFGERSLRRVTRNAMFPTFLAHNFHTLQANPREFAVLFQKQVQTEIDLDSFGKSAIVIDGVSVSNVCKLLPNAQQECTVILPVSPGEALNAKKLEALQAAAAAATAPMPSACPPGYACG